MPSLVGAGSRRAPVRALPRPAPTSPRELSDEALLSRAAVSDPDATSAFVERFQRRVYGLALTILGDSRAAADVAHDALTRGWHHAAVFDARRGSAMTWLLTITRNLAIDALRARGPVAIDADDLLRLSGVVSGRHPMVADARDDVERLRDALAGLPDESRRALLLAGVWRLSTGEIADREQISLATAAARIRTAAVHLRAALTVDAMTE